MLYGPQFLVCSAYSVLSAAMSLGARLEPRVAGTSSISCLIVAQSPALSNGLYAYLAAIQNAATNTKSTTMAVRRVRICCA